MQPNCPAWCRILGKLRLGTLVAASIVAVPAFGSDAPGATAIAGVRLNDEDAASALTLFESGQTDNATDHLKKLIADPNSAKNKERDGELKAALSILYARSGQLDKASAMLRPLGAPTDHSPEASRARVLLAASTGAYKDGTKLSKDLAGREAWLNAVRGVRTDLGIKLGDADTKLGDAVKQEQWSALPAAISATATIADEIDAVQVDRPKSQELLTKHTAGLETLSKQLGKSIQEHKDTVARLQNERNHSRGANNRETKKDLTAELKTENDKIDTLQNAQKLIDEARESVDQGAAKRRAKSK